MATALPANTAVMNNYVCQQVGNQLLGTLLTFVGIFGIPLLYFEG